jgi:YHS domain-containing protein
MDVDPKMAITRSIAGRTYYFLSEACAKSYESQQSDVSSYAKPEVTGRQGQSIQSKENDSTSSSSFCQLPVLHSHFYVPLSSHAHLRWT